MSTQIKGKLITKLPEVTGQGQKGTWIKQSFIIETDGQYPKQICLDAWGDVVDAVDIIKSRGIGTFLTIDFEPESREFNGKWYTNLRAWKIEVGASLQTVQVSKPEPPPAQSGEGEDSLPF